VISAETILHRIIKSAQIARDVRGGRFASVEWSIVVMA